MKDQELISEILSGNKNLYRHLVEKYQDRVFRVCMGFVHNKEDADDLTQQVFINTYLSLENFEGKSEFSTWLHRISINACLNHVRKNDKRHLFRHLDTLTRKDKQNEVLTDTEISHGADQQLIDKQHAKQVQNAIGKLPEKQRTAFILSKYDDLPQQEIARIMNTSVGAIEQLLQRAKSNLQKQLAGYYKNNFLNP